jgi:hypothetical protein
MNGRNTVALPRINPVFMLMIQDSLIILIYYSTFNSPFKCNLFLSAESVRPLPWSVLNPFINTSIVN